MTISLNVFNAANLERLTAMNQFCRARRAQGYQIQQAYLSLEDDQAYVQLDAVFKGTIPESLTLLAPALIDKTQPL